MVFSLTTQNKVVQPTNFGNLISVGSVQANALNGEQTGVPQPQLGSLIITPLAASTNNLLTASIPTANSYVTLTAGSGVTAVSGIYNSYTNTTDTVYFFDTPRALSATLAGASSAVTLTVWGFDEDNVFMSENISLVGSSTVYGKKAFAGVTRIWTNATPGSNLSIGTSDIIGLPYRLVNKAHIITNNYASNLISSGISTLVAGQSPVISTPFITANSILQITRTVVNTSIAIGFLAVENLISNTSFQVGSFTSTGATVTDDVSSFSWNIVNATEGAVVQGDGSSATATTGDVRGTVTLPIPSDGGHTLQFIYAIENTTINVSTQNYASIYGVPQYATPYK
jgi:hypothetical protein